MNLRKHHQLSLFTKPACNASFNPVVDMQSLVAVRSLTDIQGDLDAAVFAALS